MEISTHTLMAAALQWPEVAEAFAPAFAAPTADLIIPNPFQRPIMQQAVDYLNAYGHLPDDGDWGCWLSALGEAVRPAVTEALGRLQGVNLDDFDPNYLISEGVPALFREAARVATYRLVELGDEIEPETFLRLAGEVAELEHGGAWPEPLPLGPPPPPALPVDVLPPALWNFVVTVAGHTQTPSDMAPLMVLSAVAVAVQAKAIVRVRGEYREPLNIFTMAVMDPGNRKSAVVELTTSAIRVWERLAQEDATHRRRHALAQVAMLREAVNTARKTAAKALANPNKTDQERADLSARLAALEKDLADAERQVPALPQLLCDDITQEALGLVMNDNNGRAAIFAPEGDVLRISGGRYGGSINFDMLKRGHAGDPIRVNRKMDRDANREPLNIPHPALTVAVTLQPSLLETLEHKKSFRGEGVFDRFLFVVPPSPLGTRATGGDVPELDREAVAAYEKTIRQLLDAMPADEAKDGSFLPHEFRLSPEARGVFYAFWAEVEQQLGPSGTLRPISGWGGKLHGAAVRLAGLLHVAHEVTEGQNPFGTPISGRAMEGAVALARALIPHALVVFNVLEENPDLSLARHFEERLVAAAAAGETWTVRDLWQRVRGRAAIKEVKDVERVLRILEDHSRVRLVRRPSSGPGKPRSPWVKLHPELFSPLRKASPKCPKRRDSCFLTTEKHPRNPRYPDLGHLGDGSRRSENAVVEALDRNGPDPGVGEQEGPPTKPPREEDARPTRFELLRRAREEAAQRREAEYE